MNQLKKKRLSVDKLTTVPKSIRFMETSSKIF